MILVDSSVWIAHLQGRKTAQTEKLVEASGREPLLVGDLILLEILQGARDEVQARRIEQGLSACQLVNLLDADLAIRAGRHYRALRRLGITIRKTADLVIGTFCIAHGHHLLHDDRDFVPMTQHLGLMSL